MPIRIRCCVPFCRRTTGKVPPDHEWICAEHWRAIPAKRRRAYGRLHRIWYGGADHKGMTIGEIVAHPKWGKRGVHRVAAERIWMRLKRAAIEAAAGIG